MTTKQIRIPKLVSFVFIVILANQGINELVAQDLTKEVYVISSYRPEIADADKISNLPLLTDTFSFNTKVEYRVMPSRIKSEYELREIKPAKMVGTPLDKLYNSHLKLGFGNYTTPLAEYSIQNLRSKEYAVGAYVFHKSSYHKFEPRAETKIPAGYGRSELAVYGKKFYRDINLEGEVGGKRHKMRFYGIDTAVISDPFEIETSDIKQAFNSIYARAGIRSTRPDSGKFAYQLFAGGNYFWDHYKYKEPHANVNGRLSIPIKSFMLNLNAAYDYYKFSALNDTLTQNLVTIHPVLSKRKDLWQVNLGARTVIQRSTDKDTVYFYPDVNFRFEVIENVLNAEVGVTGYLERNSYAHISDQNPYIIPGINAPNTNHAIVAYFSLEGYLSRKASYRAEVNWQAMEDVVFYSISDAPMSNISDTTILGNLFNQVTDDADLINYKFEFNWKALNFLDFKLNTNFYDYSMYAEAKPWHRPSFDMVFATRYNYLEKIYVGLDFIAQGKRYAFDLRSSEESELDPIIDLNLKLEYKFSNILSFFLHGYNLTNKKHYLWDHYRSQGLNIIGGVSYKF